MIYIIERFNAEGRWEPLIQNSVGTVSILPQRINYSSEEEAKKRAMALSDAVRPRSRQDYYRVVRLQPPSNPAKYAWEEGKMAPLDVRKDAIDGKLAQLHEEVQGLVEEKERILGYTEVKCLRNNHGPGCGKKMPIRDLVYIQTHHYVEPSGCSDGDYWVQSEGNFDCPHCGQRQRLYDQKPIEALKRLFRGVTEEHDH